MVISRGECDNVLSGQGYRRVWSNGGMVISRGNVIMLCLVRAIDECGTTDWCYAGESRRNS